MQARDKYSYSKHRKQINKPVGGGRVFVSPKVKYSYNPMLNLPINFWGNVGILIVIIFLLWLVFYSPLFRLQEVIVEGNSLVPTEDITGAVKQNSNIFQVNINDIEKRILEINPIIKDVAIYRGIPDALKIVVLEKTPLIVWLSNNDLFLLDEEGYVDKKIGVDEFPELMKIYDQKGLNVKVGNQIVSPDFIAFAQKINSDFYNSTNIESDKFEVKETTFDLFVYTKAGFYVKFDTTRSADKQLVDLKNIIIEHRDDIHEYVDVRINGWAYYK